jgi:ribosomal protein L11 methyltransferase
MMTYVWSKLTGVKWVDAWEERFAGGQLGTLVVTLIPGRKTARLELFCESEKVVRMVAEEFGGSVRKMKDQNWAALAPEPADPVKIRDAMVICAARSAAEVKAAQQQFPGKLVLAVPADMAFGTGHHATTATVLRLLVDEARRRKQGGAWSMLDVGCGSGILAIAAQKLGASPVRGFDFDNKAVKVSHENAQRNGVDEVVFEELDVLKWKPKKKDAHDVVAANLFADILEDAFPTLLKVVKPGGILIVSGVLAKDADACLEAALAAGFSLRERVQRGKWVTAVVVPAVDGEKQ